MSHLVKQSQLHEILEHSWRKTKDRYDGAFNGVTLTPNTDTEKKLKFTKVGGGNTVDVDLVDYARLTDQNNFKQDVAADDVAVVNNLHLGTLNGSHNLNRFSGCRTTTSKRFVDGYVDHLLVLVDTTLTVDEQTNWKVWAVKKRQNKTDDAVFKAYHTSGDIRVAITEHTINGQTEKCAKIPIKEKFPEEVYFIVQCVGKPIRVITNIPTGHNEHIVNLSSSPQNTANSAIPWNSNAEANMVALYLFGRESIGSLSEKIDTIKSGQVLSVNTQRPDTNGNITIGISDIPNLESKLDEKVPKTDLTLEGGTTSHVNKVPKLDSNGKLHTSVIPELAITRVLSAANEGAVRGMIGDNKTQIQIGDVVVLEDSRKAYMYKGQTGGSYNFANDFLELTMGNGTVKKISGGSPDNTGNVSVLVTEGGQQDGITMSFGTGGTSVKIATYMTANEVQTIKDIFNS